MPLLVVTTRDGQTREIEGEAGISVMEVLRDAGVDEIVALCGGCMSCATCHVYVDPDYADRFPPISEAEDQLLSEAEARTSQSRLSCQLPFDEAVAAVRVTVAPEE